ncbi:phage tail tube protein [Methylibium sp.]|uniref:phage tail tube protein n=1 Tax=Methylibium sp. TaxID=2067992 RepID=UPI003BABC8B6
MSGINVWSNVAVAVQTVLGTAKVITAISKTNPAEVTSATHGFTAGQFLLLTVQGMRQLNLRVVKVAPTPGTDDFELVGIDSTLFADFVSGTAQLITFGAEAATFQDVNASGGIAADIPVGTIHDDEDRVIPGNKSAIKYEFGSLWNIGDAALIELQKASDTKTTRAVRLTFATGDVVAFDCYPSAPLVPVGSSGAAVTTPVSFSLAGRLTTIVA